MRTVCFFLKQSHIDHLTTNLRMDAAFVKEQMHITWHCETGIIENMATIVREFKLSHKLIVSFFKDHMNVFLV